MVKSILALVPVLAGCSIAAGLGDPKQLLTGEGDDAGETIGDDAGTPSDDAGRPSDEAGAPSDEAGTPSDASVSSLQPIAIAVGGTHACAIVQGGPGDPLNGTVRCWGSNAQGELGVDPSHVSESATPLTVPEGTTPPVGSIATLALGAGSSCATTTNGFFQCWGSVPAEAPLFVHREQETPAFEPSLVDVGNDRLVQVTRGSLGPGGGAVLAAQALVCWGNVTYGAPNAGPDGGSDDVTFGPFSAAAVGRAHACAITSDGSDVACWGDNSRGQTGVPARDGPTVPIPTYVGLSTLNMSVKAVAAGGDFSCALMADGAVYCWGANDVGQLGNPTVTQDTNVPTRVSLGQGVVAVELALGDAHGCVATAGYFVHCWGDDSAGQLGIGPTGPTFQATPVLVEDASATHLKSVQHVAAGGNTTCSTRLGDRQVWCWGANDSGQAGQSPSMSIVAYATPFGL
jgi:alpha-tubulin suppressor-like RCC1 family protein